MASCPAPKLMRGLPENQVTLADQQADPNSPLFSAKSFEDLNLCVARANIDAQQTG